MSQTALTVLSRPDIWFAALALAGFLCLYWALRGAPPGQSAPEEGRGVDAPPPRVRDRIAAGVVVGLVLVVAGAYVAAYAGIPWSLPAFAAGFGLVIVAGNAARKHRHASPILRRVARSAETGLTASLLAGVLIVGNVLAFKYGERPFDLTAEKVYSLEPLSLRQIDGLDRPLRMTAFYGNQPRTRRQVERVLQLLRLYRDANPDRVTVQVVQPYANPAEFEALRERAPGVAVTPGGGVLIEYGEGKDADRLIVTNDELFEGDPMASLRPDAPPSSSVFVGEDALTSALIRLRQGKKAKVAFLTGHGELSVHDMAPNKPGVGLLRSRLESVGFEVVVQNPLLDPLPADLAAAVIVAPQRPYQPQEVERLRDFTARGGKVLMTLDGRIKTGLEEWLGAVDIRLGDKVIVDPRYNFRRSPLWPLAPIVGDSPHPIVEPLSNQYPVVPEATPMTLGDPTRRAPSGVQRSDFATPILRTSPGSWAESDVLQRPLQPDPPGDQPGPFVVGAAVAVAPAERAEVGREVPVMVVFSSPLLGDNRAVAYDPANLDLILNSLNWLRGRPELQGLTPRKHVALTLPADPGLRARLVFLPTLIALAIIVGFGVATYLARRS